MSRLILAALLLSSAGCYASNVVAEQDRAVVLEQTQLSWRPATAEDLPGFYASREVEGASAGALLRAYYFFGHDGHYSGGALVTGEGGPQFLVIAEEGRWTLDELGLDLHDGSPPVRVEAAPGHLRLISEDSQITFERVELQ